MSVDMDAALSRLHLAYGILTAQSYKMEYPSFKERVETSTSFIVEARNYLAANETFASVLPMLDKVLDDVRKPSPSDHELRATTRLLEFAAHVLWNLMASEGLKLPNMVDPSMVSGTAMTTELLIIRLHLACGILFALRRKRRRRRRMPGSMDYGSWLALAISEVTIVQDHYLEDLSTTTTTEAKTMINAALNIMRNPFSGPVEFIRAIWNLQSTVRQLRNLAVFKRSKRPKRPKRPKRSRDGVETTETHSGEMKLRNGKRLRGS